MRNLALKENYHEPMAAVAWPASAKGLTRLVSCSRVQREAGCGVAAGLAEVAMELALNVYRQPFVA